MDKIVEHENRLTHLRMWANSVKEPQKNSDSVYLAVVGSVLGLGILWTTVSQYTGKTEDPTLVIQTPMHNGLELETDDDE